MSSVKLHLPDNFLRGMVRWLMSHDRPIPPSKLLLRTVQLMDERPRTLTVEKIANDTGLGIYWLKQFTRSDKPNSSSVDRIELLYEYLSHSTLELR